MKKKIVVFLSCFAVIVSLFVSSFSVSAAESGTWYRRWVDSTNSGTQTYWFTNVAQGSNDSLKESWCPGTSFSGSPGGYVYDVYRQGGGSFHRFIAQADFGRVDTISSWLNTILIEPDTRLTITLRGYLEGDFDWDTTWYQIFGYLRYQKDGVWQEPVMKCLMTDAEGNLVDYGKNLTPISDTKASFYLRITFKNTSDLAYAVQGFRIYFDHKQAMSSYKFCIYDVEYKHYSESVEFSEEFDSVDNSTEDRVAIDGFFSFLNKPLNLMLSAFRNVGGSFWSKIPSGFQDLIQDSLGFFKTFSGTLNGLIETYITQPLVTNFNSLVSHLSDFVSDPLGNIKSSFSNLGYTLKNFIVDPVGNFFTNLIGNIRTLLSVPLEALKTAFNNLGHTLTVFIIDPVKNFFDDPIGAIKNGVSAIGTAISNLANAIWNVLPQWLRDSLTAVGNFVSNFTTTIGKSISDFFTQRFEDLKTLLSNIGAFLQNVGSAIVNGAKAVWTAVQFIGTSLVSWAVMIGYLPNILGLSMGVVVSLGIIKLILSFI